jgi:transcriptional regulator with XRE-family HTH domain
MGTEDKGYFATRLKELRARAELSQGKLAESSDLAVSTIRQFEYGLREPTYSTLVKLARGLGVTLDAFDPEVKEKPPAAKKARKGKK